VTDPSGANFPVTVNGTVNQTVTLPGAGTITFNERQSGTGSLSVTGMHINITSGSTNWNVIVAFSHSDILCSGIIITPGEVNVSGRVLDLIGTPIQGAAVNILNTQGQVVRSAASSATGTYTLQNITVGQTYIVQASHRSFLFQPISINLLEEMNGVDLRGTPR
jgi:hypothetical protein